MKGASNVYFSSHDHLGEKSPTMTSSGLKTLRNPAPIGQETQW
jgi:hypothetical protein